MILRYPDGPAGIALLLLRGSCALSVFPALALLRPTFARDSTEIIVSSMIALALVVGLATRTAALLVGAALVADLMTASDTPTLFCLSLVGSAGALILLGAGAYSLDALRYGRRVIRLELRPPDRGSPS